MLTRMVKITESTSPDPLPPSASLHPGRSTAERAHHPVEGQPRTMRCRHLGLRERESTGQPERRELVRHMGGATSTGTNGRVGQQSELVAQGETHGAYETIGRVIGQNGEVGWQGGECGDERRHRSETDDGEAEQAGRRVDMAARSGSGSGSGTMIRVGKERVYVCVCVCVCELGIVICTCTYGSIGELLYICPGLQDLLAYKLSVL